MGAMARLVVLALVFAGMTATAALADSGECVPSAATQKAFDDHVAKAEVAEQAGRLKDAYGASLKVAGCPVAGSAAQRRLEGLRQRTSLKLGDQAESKGRFSEAYVYYSENYHGIPADRVQMKLATSKPDDLGTVQAGVIYFQNTRKALRHESQQSKRPDFDRAVAAARQGYTGAEDVARADPQRGKRLQAIERYLKRLVAIATGNGEKALAAEEKAFAARRTSLAARKDSLAELKRAQAWLGLANQERRAHERAVKRGDALLAEDARQSLELSIAYYQFARTEPGVRKAKDKARRLGDERLQEGEKKAAADYYAIAGLSDKAAALERTHEAEKEKAEGKRQKQFKKDQDALEKELGM